MKRSLKIIRKNINKEIKVYRQAMNHPDTPRSARWLLWMALGYLAMPFDLIPDMIPVVGLLDDAILVPGLIYLALRQIPNKVLTECRKDMDTRNPELF